MFNLRDQVQGDGGDVGGAEGEQLEIPSNENLGVTTAVRSQDIPRRLKTKPKDSLLISKICPKNEERKMLKFSKTPRISGLTKGRP